MDEQVKDRLEAADDGVDDTSYERSGNLDVDVDLERSLADGEGLGAHSDVGDYSLRVPGRLACTTLKEDILLRVNIKLTLTQGTTIAATAWALGLERAPSLTESSVLRLLTLEWQVLRAPETLVVFL